MRKYINSPPCFFVFSFSFFNLISSSVFIPKFKLSSENTKQLMKSEAVLKSTDPQLLTAQSLSEVF